MKSLKEVLSADYKITDQTPVDPKYHTPPEAEVSKSVKKVWFLDCQWSDLPSVVEDQVRELWQYMGYGNDNFIYQYDPKYDKLLKEKYPYILEWLEMNQVPSDEQVLIHWWW